jgi:CTP synthase (UTP-ammonia lyase)
MQGLTKTTMLLGLCLGMQIAVIEFAREVLGTDSVNSQVN